MSLKTYSHDEIAELSMIETAYLILTEEKKAADFRDLFDRLSELKQFSQAQKDNSIAQFYTDLNTDGRFMTIGSNLWGLKQWYPFEQIDEEITAAPKKKKAKKKAVVEDDFDEDFDEEVVDELDLELVEEDFDDLDDDDDDTDDDVDPAENLDDSRVKDDDYDGDYRSDKLDDEDREVVKEDTSYVGDEDDTKNNDDNYR